MTVARQDIVIPNYYVNMFEMDLFVMKQSGIITEYELKISRSDFLADFKKKWGPDFKHDLLKSGKRKCNRFYFVVPENMVTIGEVPKHCGLIYCPKKRHPIRCAAGPNVAQR